MKNPDTPMEASMQAEEIKRLLHSGKINYDEAVSLVKPRLEIMEQRAWELAKKHKMRARRISVSSFLR